MKIFDCFTFFNELDLLEFRLRFLDPFVDHFVIAESNLTFNGKTKPYYFQEARDRFKSWDHKIIHIPVAQQTTCLKLENEKKYNPNSSSFKLEKDQRNALMGACHQMEDHDLVLMGDLDEIPDPRLFNRIRKADTPLAFSMLFHYYFMNCQGIGSCRWWNGTIASTARQFREITPQGLRDKRDIYPTQVYGGWHFSFLGNPEQISQKIRSYSHTEYNYREFFDEEHIRKSILKGEDVLKREGMKFKLMPLSYYPEKLQRLMKTFPGFVQHVKSGPFEDLYFLLRRLLKGAY
ncbi:MAG: hypothetical protein IPP31_02320 [Chitinophagaceae bacterium]|nr:hypothetical protein [Chitinophagaceae bacterium]